MTSQLKNGPPTLIGNAACHSQSHPHLDRFCSWTPQNGYTNVSRCYNRTIVRLDSGSHYWTLTDLIAKVNALGVTEALGGVTEALPADPTVPADPTAGSTIINKHGATLKYRSDNKWQCTNCNACFIHDLSATEAVLEHKGFGRGRGKGRQCAK